LTSSKKKIVSFYLALTSSHTYGGVVALSTWLPLSTTFPQVEFKSNFVE